MKKRVAEEFQPGLLELTRLDRSGSAAAVAEDGSARRIVYFKTVLKLTRDFDFGAWDQPNAAALVALLGAGPRGIAGVRQGGNKAGDELRAFGSAEYAPRDGQLALVPPRGFAGPKDMVVAGTPPPGVAETLIEAIRIALKAGPTDTNPTGRRIVEEELESANLSIQARFARLREGIAIASGPPSGEYWRIAEAHTKVKADVALRNLATDGSIENLRLLRAGKVGLAIAQADMARAAALGTGAFKEDGPNPSLRALAALYPEAMHVIVPRDSAIRDLTDLAGKRVGVGLPGSGARRNAEDALALAGATQGTTLVSSDLRGLMAGLRDGLVDAVIYTIGAPNNEILSAFAAAPLRLVPLADAMVDKAVVAEAPYRAGAIPAGTYAGQAQAVRTLTVPALLVGDARMTEAEVRNVLIRLFAVDYVRAGSLQGAMIGKATARGVAGVPMHSGATAYFNTP